MKFLTVLKIFNDLKKKKVFEDYAIGGAVAVNYYTDVRDTIDLDLYLLTDDAGYSLLWENLTSMGYKPKGHRIEIEGILVDMFPVSIHLIFEEALRDARRVRVRDIWVKVFRPEYLIATKLVAFRDRDQVDVRDLFRFTDVNMSKLEDILRRYSDEKTPLLRRLQKVLGKRQ